MRAARNGTRKKGGAYLRQRRVVRYHFVDEERSSYPVRLVCRVMRVSAGAYYLYASGESYTSSPAKAELGKQVKEVFWAHRRRYGARRAMEHAALWSTPRYGARRAMEHAALWSTPRYGARRAMEHAALWSTPHPI